jgi:HAD superfamily hydrolase (TIGR01509 family)
MGHHWDDCVARITQRWGRPPPPDLRERRAARWGTEITGAIAPVPGVVQFIEKLGRTPRAIASSSRAEWIETTLAGFGLLHAFSPNIFSAPRDVSRGKPHPDIYQHAMRTMGFAPNETWVIEDTPIGVRAGVAAGATVVGLCAGTHIRSGHADVLRAAGVHHIAEDYGQVAAIMGI